MKLTVRTLNEQVRETVLQRIHDIAVAQAESFNATATLTHVNGSPVLRNDPAANAMVREVATALFGAEQVGEVKPFMGSEDFAFMLEQHPTAVISLSALATSRIAAWCITRAMTSTTRCCLAARRCGAA